MPPMKMPVNHYDKPPIVSVQDFGWNNGMNNVIPVLSVVSVPVSKKDIIKLVMYMNIVLVQILYNRLIISMEEN
jgi:hypothetical protein